MSGGDLTEHAQVYLLAYALQMGGRLTADYLQFQTACSVQHLEGAMDLVSAMEGLLVTDPPLFVFDEGRLEFALTEMGAVVASRLEAAA